MFDKLKTLIPLHEIEAEAYAQILNVLKLPQLKKLAIMPDVHAGYDLCIGGVALLDEQSISPSFVGYDIGCGISSINLGVNFNELFKNNEDKYNIYNDILNTIPVGFSLREKSIPYKEFVSESESNTLEFKVNSKLNKSVGTLGGGNHFIEIGYDKHNMTCITIHSGSRNIGHSIGDFYMKQGRILHLDTDIGKAYLNDMNFALQFALNNRKVMLKQICSLLNISFDSVSFSMINENHNHALVTKDGVLHRKGATPADLGQLGVIPANMRDGVYITRGLGNDEFLSSASHGAGRVMSRSRANKEIPLDLFQTTMSENDIIAKVDGSTLDESPFAYKDIDTVLKYQEGIVVEVINHIKPSIVIKG